MKKETKQKIKKKLLIFDFSGTLAYFEKSYPEGFFPGMSLLGMEVKTEEEVNSFSDLLRQLLIHSEDLEDFSVKILDHFSVKRNQETIKRVADFFRDFIRFHLFEDTEELIDLPVKKAVLSSASDFLIKQELPQGYEIFGSKSSEFQKPDPRAFLMVLEKLKVKSEHAAMVGDEIERDLVPAQKLGIETVLIDRENEAKDYSGIRINSLKEIKDIFDF